MTTHESIELSEREREILRLVATGASNKEIAQKLVISPNTVKVHMRNIFAKIGAASRTEAAMYAVKIGLVDTFPDLKIDEGAREQIQSSNFPPTLNDPIINLPHTSPVIPFEKTNQDNIGDEDLKGAFPDRKIRFLSRRMIGIIVFGTIIFSIILINIISPGFINSILFPTNGIEQESPINNSEIKVWQALLPLDTPRARMATCISGNKIYLSGGIDPSGITSSTIEWDLTNNLVQHRAEKPTAVSDSLAVQAGGLIYVPGGLLPNGMATNVLEAFDPFLDKWLIRSPMPEARSGYALVAFEGDLYLFGGWDGTDYQEEIFRYDPELDQWNDIGDLPSKRAYASAVVSAGQIHIIGGKNEQQVLPDNDIFQSLNIDSINWIEGTPLPEGRYGMGVVSLADIIFIFGGINQTGSTPFILQYDSQSGDWEQTQGWELNALSHFGIVSQGTRIIILGGQTENKLSQNTWGFQPLYTILIPIVK